MSSSSARWNLVVSSETDQALRQYLAGSGGGHKGDLSRFVEEAVQARIWDLTVDQIKAKNADRPQAEIESIVDEALEWARIADAHHPR